MFERFVAGALRARWMVLVIGTLTAALVLPSGGSAQSRQRSARSNTPFEVLYTPRLKTTHGFRLSLEGGNRLVFDTRQGRPVRVRDPEAVTGADAALRQQGQPGFLNADLSKQSGKGAGAVSQDASYSFRSGITFKGSASLKNAKITGRLRDHRGQVRLTFNATHPVKPVPVPKGCTGTAGARRKGVVTGKFVLKADRLGKQTLGSVAATLVRPPNLTSCRPSGGGPHSVSLVGGVTGTADGAFVGATKTQGARFVSEYVQAELFGSGFSFDYRVSVNVPRSEYTYASDLSAAEVAGYGAIKGSASYLGDAETNGQSQGQLSGDLSATNAAVGKIRPLAAGPVDATQTQS